MRAARDRRSHMVLEIDFLGFSRRDWWEEEAIVQEKDDSSVVFCLLRVVLIYREAKHAC